MPSKFNVLLNEIKAAILFASTDDSRYVLNSVNFECRPGAKPLLVGCNGRTLGVIETDAEQLDYSQPDAADKLPPCDCRFTMGIAALKPFCAFAKAVDNADVGGMVTIEYHHPTRVVIHIPCGGTVVDFEKGAVIEGDFPNFRQVVPVGDKTPVSHLGINPEYVADFGKAGKLLGADPALLQVNMFSATQAYEIRIGGKPNFYGLLMPVKPDENVEWQPEFLGIGGETKPKPTETTVTIKAGSNEVTMSSEAFSKAAKKLTGK